jgi:hypothetical protein
MASFYLGDKVYVCTRGEDGMPKHLYDATVVEADEWKVRILVREGTYGWWFEQETGVKIGVSSRFITKKLGGWRSIDDE